MVGKAMAASYKEKSEICFGIIADVQYADIEDGYNFHRTKKRYYRSALQMLQKAVAKWNADDPKPAFILQLGDIIDGFNKRYGLSTVCLQRTLDAFAAFSGGPVYHTWGNHELYNFPREYLFKTRLFSGMEQYAKGSANKAYYSAQPHKKLRIVVLDCYDIAVLGYPDDVPESIKARKILVKNPNKDKNAPDGLHGVDRRFVKFNGAVGVEQLAWLDRELQEAEQQNQNVVVIGHLPVYEECTNAICLCWNYDEVHAILQKYSKCVLCYLAGHDHDGGDAMDTDSILHITFQAALENNQEADFATAYLLQDSLEIVGNGRISDFSVALKYPLG